MIDYENCIKNVQNLSIHPKWWENKTIEEQIVGLEIIYAEILAMRNKIISYENLTFREREFVADLERYMAILTGDRSY